MKLSLAKIKVFIRKATKKVTSFPLTIATNVFFSFVILSVVVIIIGALVYYRYGIIAQAGDDQVKETEIPQLNKDILRDVLKQMDEKERKMEEINVIEYPDPFNPQIISEPEIVDQ